MNQSVKQCVPCGAGASTASEADISEALSRLSQWQRSADGKAIERKWTFSNYANALAFVQQVSVIAEAQNHHPDIAFGWGYAAIRLTTHSIDGLHANDFVMAELINEINDAK